MSSSSSNSSTPRSKVDQSLEQLKKMMKEEDKDPWATDVTLKRFLKAQEYDVEKAYKMYTKCIEWRRTNKIDEVLDNPPEKLEYYRKLVSHKNHGFDKQGRPIYIEIVGKIHYPTLLEYLTVDDLIDVHIWQLEENARLCKESSEKLGKEVYQSVSIVDLAGLSMHHRHGLSFIKACAKIDEAYYPETMGKLYIINAPRLFPFFWGICKAWVHPNTQKKIEVLSGNYEKVLKENIPAHFLPAEMGGKCTCGQFDSEGKKKPVSEESKSEKKSEKKSELKPEHYCVPIVDITEMKEQLKYRGDEYDSMSHTSLTVKAGQFEEVVCSGIDAEGTHFSWNFRTVAKNIEFSIICRPKGEATLRELKEKHEHEICPATDFHGEFKRGVEFHLLEKTKMDKHKGVFRVPAHCDLVFRFDNSYSWMNGKNIRYKVTATCLSDC